MKRLVFVLAVIALAAMPYQARAQDWDAGFRLNVVGGTGKPTNDVLGYGLFARHRLNDRWAIAFGVDRAEAFDIEKAAELVGLRQDPNVKDIDNKADSTAVKVWLEREFRAGQKFRWFWGAGVGYNDISAQNASGPTDTGGRFDVKVDAGSEFLLEGSLGFRSWMGNNWFFESALRVEQHFADWKLVDLESGNTGAISDYTLRGVHLGLGYSF